MPGGIGRPAVSSRVFSCIAVSTLALASLWAARIRSSRISTSSSLNSDGSIFELLHLELARHRHLDHAAAGLAGDLHGGDLFLHGLELGLHFLGLAHQAQKILHRLLSVRSRLVVVVAAPVRRRRGVSARSGRLGASGMRTSMIFAPGNFARMAATAGSLRASVSADSRRLASSSASVGPPSSRDSDTIQLRPVQACSLAVRSLSSVFGASAVSVDVEPAGLDPHQAHAARSEHLEGHVAVLVGERGDVGERGVPERTAARGRLAAGRQPMRRGARCGAHRRGSARRAASSGRRRRMRARCAPPAPPPLAEAPRAAAAAGRGAAPRAAAAAPARVVQRWLQRLVERRQVGGVRDADQHHLAGADRPVGGLHLGNALEQHLPGARQHAHRQCRRRMRRRARARLGQRGVVRPPPARISAASRGG